MIKLHIDVIVIVERAAQLGKRFKSSAGFDIETRPMLVSKVKLEINMNKRVKNAIVDTRLQED